MISELSLKFYLIRLNCLEELFLRGMLFYQLYLDIPYG